MVPEIEVQRVYDAAPRRGAVFLVDRIWPRGVRKDDLVLDGWLRDLAPSGELRKWYGHRPERWPQFRARYHEELDHAGSDLETLLEAARRGPVTLLYGARDKNHNNAVALREYLLERVRS